MKLKKQKRERLRRIFMKKQNYLNESWENNGHALIMIKWRGTCDSASSTVAVALASMLCSKLSTTRCLLVFFGHPIRKRSQLKKWKGKKKKQKSGNRRDSGTPRVEDLFRREPQDCIEFSRFRWRKKKRKRKFIFLSYKTKFNIWRGTLSLLLFFFSFTIVSFPLGFYIYLHSSSLCYSPSHHFSSETSNLNLFSLCFPPPLLSFHQPSQFRETLVHFVSFVFGTVSFEHPSFCFAN